MKITLVEFEFGMTQNLGDYTNTRPSVKLVAEVGEDDAPDLVLHHLAALARTAVHDIVDNELELAGRQVGTALGGVVVRAGISNVVL